MKMEAGLKIVRAGGLAVPAGTHEGKLIVIGADHRGFKLKERLKRILRRRGWRVKDVGTHSPRRVDYPLIALKIARPVGASEGKRAVGIGVCGSGIGVCIVSAKVPGVFPALPRDVAQARTTRRHNNTNFLCVSAESTTTARAAAIAEAWLRTPFCQDPGRDGRYLRRYLQTARLDRARR